MKYITQSPTRVFGELRLQIDLSPALKASDYKDPLIIIETDDDTLQPIPRRNLQNHQGQLLEDGDGEFLEGGSFGATGVIEIEDE